MTGSIPGGSTESRYGSTASTSSRCAVWTPILEVEEFRDGADQQHQSVRRKVAVRKLAIRPQRVELDLADAVADLGDFCADGLAVIAQCHELRHEGASGLIPAVLQYVQRFVGMGL